MRRLAPAAAAVVAAFALLLGSLAVSVATAPSASAADFSKFDPGNLISDQIFYDSGTMSASDVQSFLAAKGSRCVPNADGTPCLKDYHQATSSRAATTRCRAYAGAADETAAQIIANVAVACGINPRVILVTLQKEQSLVTRTTAGSASVYQKAMGFGCPDTAPCDALYYGFFNQVYSAASQFRNYAQNPTWYSHRAGAWNTIAYNPNAACGSSSVYIRNQATASLYNYTPYQPNAAALAAGYGSGDSCSAYGNRNFWAYFSDWFGSPTGVPPIGFLDSVTVQGLSVTAAGWALDPDTTAPITVHMYVDGASQAFTAGGSRPDVDAAFHLGANHGYTTTMQATPGVHTVCIWAINTDVNSGNSSLGCRTVTVPRPLMGFLDGVTPDPTGVTARGWAYDPDGGTSPAQVQVSVDGAAPVAFSANASRPDLATALGIDPNHGFVARVPASLGQHEVCVVALKPAPGTNASLGCKTVTVVNQTPIGFLDGISVSAGTLTVTGWALDPDTTDPITVHMYVDGSSKAFTADGDRPDVDAAFHLGAKHGYSAQMPVLPGQHNVCLYAINTTPGPNPQLGCRTITIADHAPFGFVDTVTVSAGVVTATGWTLDPDTTAPITVHMYVDGASKAFTADGLRPDVDSAFHLGAAHGFTTQMPITAGQHTVCLYAIDTTPGPNPNLGCRTVTGG